MALVIMRLPGRNSGRQGQNQLCAVQRLKLAFLVHAQDYGPLGRVHIQADDVPDCNREPAPFIWKADADLIFGKIQRLCTRLLTQDTGTV